jgi:5-formyltetrahydrofolate cyclo-ligase
MKLKMWRSTFQKSQTKLRVSGSGNPDCAWILPGLLVAMALLPNTSTHQAKLLLRRHILAILKAQDAVSRHHAGVRIAEYFANWLKQCSLLGSGVALFDALPSEVDTEPLNEFLREQKIRRFLPRWQTDHPSLHFYDVDSGEPADERDMAVVVVPGLAFDKAGRRLGRGKGYYDRFLSLAKAWPHRPHIVGVALDCQLLPQAFIGVIHDPIFFRARRRAAGDFTAWHCGSRSRR